MRKMWFAGISVLILFGGMLAAFAATHQVHAQGMTCPPLLQEKAAQGGTAAELLESQTFQGNACVPTGMYYADATFNCAGCAPFQGSLASHFWLDGIEIDHRTTSVNWTNAEQVFSAATALHRVPDGHCANMELVFTIQGNVYQPVVYHTPSLCKLCTPVVVRTVTLQNVTEGIEVTLERERALQHQVCYYTNQFFVNGYINVFLLYPDAFHISGLFRRDGQAIDSATFQFGYGTTPMQSGLHFKVLTTSVHTLTTGHCFDVEAIWLLGNKTTSGHSSPTCL